MYYLSCVVDLTDLDNEGSELTDFPNYFRLNTDQEQTLVAFCLLLNPLELLGQYLLVVEPEDPRLHGSSNKMYSIKSTITSFAATKTVLIGGRIRKVDKVMLFTRKWMDNNYLSPMKCFTQQPLRRNVPPITYVSIRHNLFPFLLYS